MNESEGIDYFELEDSHFSEFEEQCKSLVLTDKQKRDLQIEALTNNNREIKALREKQLLILQGLSDKEKLNKLYDSVCKAHKGILQEDGTLPEVLTACFDGELDDLEFLLANRHTSFYKCADVFLKYKDHPVQKELVKNKAVSLRGVKKSKTAHQHMSYMHSGKDVYSRQKKLEKQLDELQERLALNERITTSILTQQTLLTECVIGVKTDVDQLAAKLKGKITDMRKAAAYSLLKNDPKATNSSVAKVFDVDRKTIRKWAKEVQLLLDEDGVLESGEKVPT